jgi:hypothetical protein
LNEQIGLICKADSFIGIGINVLDFVPTMATLAHDDLSLVEFGLLDEGRDVTPLSIMVEKYGQPKEKNLATRLAFVCKHSEL